jgi:hypothetical protein
MPTALFRCSIYHCGTEVPSKYSTEMLVVERDCWLCHSGRLPKSRTNLDLGLGSRLLVSSYPVCSIAGANQAATHVYMYIVVSSSLQLVQNLEGTRRRRPKGEISCNPSDKLPSKALRFRDRTRVTR